MTRRLSCLSCGVPLPVRWPAGRDRSRRVEAGGALGGSGPHPALRGYGDGLDGGGGQAVGLGVGDPTAAVQMADSGRGGGPHAAVGGDGDAGRQAGGQAVDGGVEGVGAGGQVPPDDAGGGRGPQRPVGGKGQVLDVVRAGVEGPAGGEARELGRRHGRGQGAGRRLRRSGQGRLLWACARLTPGGQRSEQNGDGQDGPQAAAVAHWMNDPLLRRR